MFKPLLCFLFFLDHYVFSLSNVNLQLKVGAHEDEVGDILDPVPVLLSSFLFQ